ncbi:MAG: hypothetical protein ACP5UN_01875 [Candidatus Micrarchaeia archaeon]
MASKTTGIIVYVALIIIVIIIWYFSTGFALPKFNNPVTTPSNTAKQNTIASNIPTNATTTNLPYIYPCNNIMLYFNNSASNSNSSVSEACTWNGGELGLWVASSNFSYENVKLIGANGKVYINQTTTYTCPTFYSNYSLPAQEYKVYFKVGPITSQPVACKLASMLFNKTLTPPNKVYNFVYNGNFSTGTYAGWNLTGKGFGTAPLNITFANENKVSRCYLGTPWVGYNGSYVATTFNCGLSNAPGNLTSSEFIANKPFLNFKIISPLDNFLYVEILYANDTPAIIAHYNTYNSTLTANASSTFRNASIPLLTVQGKIIKIRVVADTLNRETYIAVGDFALSNLPHQDRGILVGSYNITNASG